MIPNDKQTYKIMFVENDDALSAEVVAQELPKAKSKSAVNGEMYMGLTSSKSHSALLMPQAGWL